MSLSNPTTTRRRSNLVSYPNLMDWFGANLPNFKDYWITDIDGVLFVFRNREGCLLLLEIKCKMSNVKQHQRMSFGILDYFVKAGHNITGGIAVVDGFHIHVKYAGFHLLVFENTSPYDGRMFWDNKEITEQELIDKLSMQQGCCC